MLKFKNVLLFFIFFSIKSEVIEIEEFLQKIIPTKKDINNEKHLFFFYFKNQNEKDFLKRKNLIKTLNLDNFVIQNQIIFETCDSHIVFFDNLIAMQKYVKIAIFSEKDIKTIQETLSNIMQKIRSDTKDIRYTEIKNHLIPLKNKFEEHETSTENINEAQLIYAHYIDHTLNLQSQEVKQKLHEKFDYKPTYLKNNDGWKQKTLITLLVVASLSVLGSYLFLTQIEEIKKNNQKHSIELPQVDNFACF